MSDQCWKCFKLFHEDVLKECQDCGFDYCIQCIDNHNEEEEEEQEQQLILKCDKCGEFSRPDEQYCDLCWFGLLKSVHELVPNIDFIGNIE